MTPESEAKKAIMDGLRLQFTAYVCPVPQGSMKAFVRGKRAILTSDNTKLKPFREAVGAEAFEELYAMGHAVDERGPYFGKHVPVRMEIQYIFQVPKSVRRAFHVVKPDLDKLVRATCDALTGIVYHDDSQVCEIVCCKRYGAVESVSVTAEEVV